jgi:FkbM family methyltransferase
MHPTLRRTARKVLPGPVYRELERRHIRAKIARYENRIVEHAYGGHRLRIALQDELAEEWYDHDWEPEPAIQALRAGRLGSGARVFDIGAHQAVVALMLAHEVGPNGEVIAVEAEPHNVRVAEANVSLNAASNVRIEHAAIDETAGSLYFSESLNGMVEPGGRAGKVRVDAVTLDGLTQRFGHPDVVFIDVEGYELRALEGGLRLLDAQGTDYFVEIHDELTLAKAGATAHQVVEHFTRRGYACLVTSAATGPADAPFRPLTTSDQVGPERSYLVAFAPT